MSEAAVRSAAPRWRSRACVGWLRSHPAIACLAVLTVCSGVLLLALSGNQIFLRDEWAVALYRPGASAGTFLDPHAGHLVVAVIVIYKALLELFGMRSPLPFHLASTLIFLASAVLLFAYARRRVGDWLALYGTSVILFFGASWIDLLSPFQMAFSGAIAAGIGALLALDREDRTGDRLACALLILSLSFSEVGLAFCAGALVEAALGRHPRRRRAYLALLPLGLWVIWWLGWGHTDTSYLSWSNVANTPRYVLDASGAAVGALAGLSSSSDHVPDPVGQAWAPVLLAVAVALAVWRLLRLGRVEARVLVVLAIGLGFWVAGGLNYVFQFREPGNARYLYPSAVFVLLIAAELLRGVRLGPRGLLVAGLVTVAALVGNIGFLADGYRYYFKPGSDQQRGAVTALEIDGPTHLGFQLNATVSPVSFYGIDAGPYLSGVRAFGSPAYTEQELRTAPEDARREADAVFGAMLGLALRPLAPGLPDFSAPGCRRVQTTLRGATGVVVEPGGAVALRSLAPAPVTVAAGRYSDELPTVVGPISTGQEALLRFPRDASPQPWRLGLEGDGPVRVCPV
ncbi:MAG: hypothetical protein EXQ70_11220 [Solirubrobacterales bacterium]|nr:hypothetical protein [Solirubrobacterales bacterium]